MIRARKENTLLVFAAVGFKFKLNLLVLLKILDFFTHTIFTKFLFSTYYIVYCL